MKLLIAWIKAAFHSIFRLHRIQKFRSVAGFIVSIECFDCDKEFYKY